MAEFESILKGDHRYLFLTTQSAKSPESTAISGSLIKAMIMMRKSDIVESKEVKFSIMEGEGLLDGEVLIFPDMLKYSLISAEDATTFVNEILVKRGTSKRLGPPETISGDYIFVCAKNQTPMVQMLMNEVAGLPQEIYVGGCAHIGRCQLKDELVILQSFSHTESMGRSYHIPELKAIPDLIKQNFSKKRGKEEVKKRGETKCDVCGEPYPGKSHYAFCGGGA